MGSNQVGRRLWSKVYGEKLAGFTFCQNKVWWGGLYYAGFLGCLLLEIQNIDSCFSSFYLSILLFPVFIFYSFFILFSLAMLYFISLFCKANELPLCIKCAIQITQPCLTCIDYWKNTCFQTCVNLTWSMLVNGDGTCLAEPSKLWAE